MTFSDSGAIFIEGDIAKVPEEVFDSPVIAVVCEELMSRCLIR